MGDSTDQWDWHSLWGFPMSQFKVNHWLRLLCVRSFTYSLRYSEWAKCFDLIITITPVMLCWVAVFFFDSYFNLSFCVCMLKSSQPRLYFWHRKLQWFLANTNTPLFSGYISNSQQTFNIHQLKQMPKAAMAKLQSPCKIGISLFWLRLFSKCMYLTINVIVWKAEFLWVMRAHILFFPAPNTCSHTHSLTIHRICFSKRWASNWPRHYLMPCHLWSLLHSWAWILEWYNVRIPVCGWELQF